jgi:hypothetical protein
LVEGLARHFPGKVVAYYEERPDWADSRVDLRDWHGIKGADTFLQNISSVSGANGVVDGKYDFRYDCNKFCRKVFAQEGVFDEDELVFWFDSDCVIKKDIPEDLLRGILPDCLAYMGRGKQGSYVAYTETGFVGFNTAHEDFKVFRSRYLPYFTSGRIFTQLRGWHDCIAFDHAREGLKGNNLSPTGVGMDAVIHKTVLAPYMEHNKGNRKYK